MAGLKPLNHKTAVRHGKLRRSASIRNFFKSLLAVALALCLSVIAVVAYAAVDLSNKIDTVELTSAPPAAQKEILKSLDGAINVLLVGSDSRVGQQSINDGEEGSLNDVTMLLRISKDHKSATAVSFPRDLLVPFPSCPGPNGEADYYSARSAAQLNSALSQGGLVCVARTIEKLTGAEIPYAGLITFDGVINMSNAVGGVDVCLTQPIKDPKTDLDLPAGNVHLVGLEALQFLRTRYGVGDGGDVSRISNQQVFLSALIRKIKSAETLSNPGKVYSLAKAAVENMTLSSNMASIAFMKSMAATVNQLDLEKVNFVQYPSYSSTRSPGRLEPDTANGRILMERILSDQPFTIGDTGAAAVKVTEPEVTAQENAESAADAPPGESPAPESAMPQPDNIKGQNAATVTCSAGRTDR
ncbi:LCP family protein [Canibacter sp. lx-72]|uniref:LCP family protein n=1 Tax=Canibacter zhuwentaonis TaxID=2837491 RepID=UPI001BDCBC63|nr:LCP family protein [Canibacter zhuwentaonis]MBT1018565.1 LCP family protein [Canibacter zhuwentaonis]